MKFDQVSNKLLRIVGIAAQLALTGNRTAIKALEITGLEVEAIIWSSKVGIDDLRVQLGELRVDFLDLGVSFNINRATYSSEAQTCLGSTTEISLNTMNSTIEAHRANFVALYALNFSS